ncbi:Hypothetical protein PBC10988_12910 [Planctomycetales bacterium 10988]|nr:Hypothetical protein PBC10988_12910 [Planctomycetales bacterium 10988]
MESSLHRTLKQHYADEAQEFEIPFRNYRMDTRQGHIWVEVQTSSLGAIRKKIAHLLANDQEILVVKPVVHRKKIVRQQKPGGPAISRRWSPSRGTMLDFFSDFIYFTSLFPHPALQIEVPFVDIEEWRLPAKKTRRRRRAVYQLQNVELLEVHSSQRLQASSDLLELLEFDSLPETFDTSEFASALQIPRWFAQKIAYCLYHAGAIDRVSKRGNAHCYRLFESSLSLK